MNFEARITGAGFAVLANGQWTGLPVKIQPVDEHGNYVCAPIFSIGQVDGNTVGLHNTENLKFVNDSARAITIAEIRVNRAHDDEPLICIVATEEMFTFSAGDTLQTSPIRFGSIG